MVSRRFVSFRPIRFVRLVCLAASIVAVLAVLLSPRLAHAQRELLSPLGGKGTLSIDQISGFRMSGVGVGAGTGGGGAVTYGVGYSGIVGFATQSVSEDIPGSNPAQSSTAHFTSFWIAPSADYFVIDHLSIGALLELATTSANVDVPFGTTGTSVNFGLPTTTSITFLPRVGWMFAITDRFGIWPRLGLGYGTHSQVINATNPNAASTDSFSSFLFDLDVGFLYRINENWFLKGTPELTFAPGSHSVTVANVTTSANEHLFQLGIVGGIGVMWDLL